MSQPQSIGMSAGPLTVRTGTRKLLKTVAVACTVFGLLAPLAGFGPTGTLAFLGLYVIGFCTWFKVASVAIDMWGRTGERKVAIVLASFAVVLALFLGEIHILAAAKKYVLPRPMFHNEFVWHERALLPLWYWSPPARGHLGEWARADYEKNLLVVVTTGVAGSGPTPRISGWGKEFHVQVDLPAESVDVAIPGRRDTLVVILPNGTNKRFSLGKGLAEQFYRARRSGSVKNMLREAGELLGVDQRKEFDKFLEKHQVSLAE